MKLEIQCRGSIIFPLDRRTGGMTVMEVTGYLNSL